MSHSAFRILANDEPINRNLVIVVNKNGQVSTDTEVLQTLLTTKGDANTGISILRETSPTPSISDEIEQERNEKIEEKRQEYLQAHEGEDIDEEELEKQMRLITGSMDDDIPHVTLNVESFYTPEQARKFANDVLHLGGIDNPQSLMPIDFNFQRQTIQNDHCYTTLTLQSPATSSQPSKNSASKNSNSQQKAVKREQKPSAKLREVEDDSSDSGEAALEDDEEYEEEQSGEDISFSESDDDNDMDFSVNDRFGKKGKKKRKYRKHKVKSSTFKDFLETGEVAEANEEVKKKYNKSPKKAAVIVKPSTSGKIFKSSPQNVIVKKQQQQNIASIVSAAVIVQPIKKTQFIPLTANFMKSAQISVSSSSLSSKTKHEIEFVESLVKNFENLEKNFPEAETSKKLTTIPTIMQMMETNTPPEEIDESLASLEQMEADAVPNIDEIGDALIAALGNDAIDELLNQNELMNFSEPLVMHEAPETPKILNISAKDPIKVVRNGRVITLPAIEAPATRGAKRRAQGDSPNTSMTSPTVEKVAKTEKTPTPSLKDPDSKNSSRRSSVSGKSSRRPSVVQGADELDDLISDASWASEDDPDRLWCICKQPHNNRFMICCDKCEDWFHGKCVNVTKSMGKEYELMGKEWRCPNCKADPGKKVDPNKKPLNQQKLTKFFAKSQKESTDEDVAKTMCVVCQAKAARDSSIYCSDECIQNHATKHLDGESAAGGSVKVLTAPKTDAAKRGNVLKDKNGNVIVYDRTTGKILPLHKSPHFTKLGQWLLQNPNFEPVKPGTPQAKQILSRNKPQPQPVAAVATPTSTTPAIAPESPVKTPKQGDDLFSNPVKIITGATPPVVVKKVHTVVAAPVRSNVVVKVALPSVSSSTPKSSKLPEKKVKKEERPASGSSTKVKAEQERQNVRNILKDTLKSRMVEFDHPQIPKLSDDDIATFAKEVEREMFLFFNKDTRDKYKTKYRSLKFNLSDVKNKTLLEKICARKVTAKQLVELPASALASEELAKWRETENKHTLEIITKSELDALSQQTTIVMKSHKGEEVIETKRAPVDILVPGEDDVEAVIAKTVLSVEGRRSGGNVSSPLSSPSISSSTGRKDHHHHHHKSSSSSSKHKRHRSRSPKHHHKDRKSRDRSKHREVKEVKPKPIDIQPDQQDVDLVGKILDSMGVHLDKPKPLEPATPLLPLPVTSTEPLSDHQIAIEIFSGNLHMADVAKFNVTASILSGNFDDILKLIPSSLDCVGRIEPTMVWDYLDKVKKFPGKEICILRFASDNESDYFNFFTYLHTRQRYGVIKSTSPKIKDFYLVPVEASRPLPKVLLPLTGPGFFEGEGNKPDLLLGVILKILPENNKTKKQQPSQKKVSSKASSSSSRPSAVIDHPIHVQQKPKSSKLTMGLPEFSKTGELQSMPTKKSPLEATDDGDEPYTPFDDDDGSLTPPNYNATTSAAATSKQTGGDDLESQMEIINREIEQRQMEIQSLAQQKVMELNEEQATRIYENISVPHNLSEILSTISSRDMKPMDIDNDDDDEYVPTAYTAGYSAMSQPAPIANSMMDIDERIAMFQGVPPAPVIGNLQGDEQPSRLSNMTDADLMKLVPDGALEAPPAPKISGPPIPGLDDDFEMN